MALIQAVSLSKTYEGKSVLKDISIAISAGETIALLGRSGCGKSTLTRLLMGLEQPDSGDVLYKGQKLAGMDFKERKAFYQNIQLVFQDSFSAVNPRFKISEIIGEPLRYLSDLTKTEKQSRIKECLAQVELADDFLDRLPHQMSGGQLQRVCIARALALRPKVILLDEAVSNLDIPLQIEILNLLEKLQKAEKISYLFVTHDFRLARKFAAQILVMESGKIVEKLPENLAKTAHPAALHLMKAVLPPFS